MMIYVYLYIYIYIQYIAALCALCHLPELGLLSATPSAKKDISATSHLLVVKSHTAFISLVKRLQELKADIISFNTCMNACERLEPFPPMAGPRWWEGFGLQKNWGLDTPK